MAKTVVGLFDTYAHARGAADALKQAGIPDSDLSMVAHESAYSGESNNADDANDSKAVHGMGSGAKMGAVAGGAAGLLAGLGVIAIPGFGPVVAAGWLISTLTGAAAGAAAGAAIGGLAGALTSVGVPEEEAGYYEEGVRRGGTLLTVRAQDDQAQRVADFMDAAGAVDIDQRADYYRTSGFAGSAQGRNPLTPEEIARDRAAYSAYASGSGTGSSTLSGTGTAATNAPATKDINAGGEVTIPIVEEQVHVGKRETQRGGARVHTYMVEQPVNESVTLREEHVHVERRPVDRAVSATDMTAFREGTIEVTETSEVPVVSKEARVVEEVLIGKEVTQRTQEVNETARRTEVDVEELTGGATAGTAGTSTTAGSSVTAGTTVDTRSGVEKVADAVTGDRIDDKTGQVVR